MWIFKGGMSFLVYYSRGWKVVWIKSIPQLPSILLLMVNQDPWTSLSLTPPDINECTTGSNDCDPDRAACSDTDGSFTCLCLTGYEGDGRNCTGKLTGISRSWWMWINFSFMENLASPIPHPLAPAQKCASLYSTAIELKEKGKNG